MRVRNMGKGGGNGLNVKPLVCLLVELVVLVAERLWRETLLECLGLCRGAVLVRGADEERPAVPVAYSASFAGSVPAAGRSAHGSI
jgi:hypothetical protein